MLQEGSYRISISCADDADYHDVKTTDSRKTKIRKILSKSDDLKYIYDFGDYWEFEIHIIDRIRETIVAPLCQDGGGATPPKTAEAPVATSKCLNHSQLTMKTQRAIVSGLG